MEIFSLFTITQLLIKKFRTVEYSRPTIIFASKIPSKIPSILKKNFYFTGYFLSFSIIFNSQFALISTRNIQTSLPVLNFHPILFSLKIKKFNLISLEKFTTKYHRADLIKINFFFHLKANLISLEKNLLQNIIRFN